MSRHGFKFEMFTKNNVRFAVDTSIPRLKDRIEKQAQKEHDRDIRIAVRSNSASGFLRDQGETI